MLSIIGLVFNNITRHLNSSRPFKISYKRLVLVRYLNGSVIRGPVIQSSYCSYLVMLRHENLGESPAKCPLGRYVQLLPL